jgi:hypothetical protein
LKGSLSSLSLASPPRFKVAELFDVLGRGVRLILSLVAFSLSSIRSAKQLQAEAFSVNIEPDGTQLKGILQKIQVALQLQTDTPRGEDMIGTLLLCLPSLFRGGDLAVEMGKENIKFFGQSGTRTKGSGHSSWWLDYSKKKANHKKIPWCAFFADTDHEIDEVTAGVRVTLAYLRRRKDGASASPLIPRTLGDTEQTVALVMALREMVADDQFLADGGNIGFPCEHLYTNAQAFPQKRSADDPLSAKATQNLKGRDRLVA